MKAEGDLFGGGREKVGEQQRDALGEAWLIISLFKVLQEQRKSVNNKYPQLHFRIYFWHFPLARIGSWGVGEITEHMKTLGRQTWWPEFSLYSLQGEGECQPHKLSSELHTGCRRHTPPPQRINKEFRVGHGAKPPQLPALGMWGWGSRARLCQEKKSLRHDSVCPLWTQTINFTAIL